MAVHLRPYTPGDFDQLYALDQQCFPRGIAYSKRMLASFLRSPRVHGIVAEDSPAAAHTPSAGTSPDPAIVAFLITEENPPIGHILTLDVAPSHRRHNVGSQLLALGEQQLAARGIVSIVLETSVENAPGVAFWQRHGYRTVGIHPRYYLGRTDAFAMRKNITREQSL
jgi:ribosomal-protein-alanine N-acetyltransferase